MNDVLVGWPIDLIRVFAAIGRAMGDQQLRPEMVDTLPNWNGAIIEDHMVKITHISGRDIGQKRGRYIIEIQGVRWLDGGRWTFASGELETLSRAAC